VSKGSTTGMTITIKCPKCERTDTHIVDEEDIKEIKELGVARIGFLHNDHALIINFDATGFIRGAYIVASDSIPSDIRVFYDNYRVLLFPKLPFLDFEIVLIDLNRMVIDLRASRLIGRDVALIMEYVKSYLNLIRDSIKRVGVAGRNFYATEHNNVVLLYNNVPHDIVRACLSELAGGENNLSSIYLAFKYAMSSNMDKDDPAFKERLKMVINAHKIRIKAKKGINAIRFARASILALWPQLTSVFDMIMSDPYIKSKDGAPLLNLMLKDPEICFDDLYEMLKELSKRDLIEIVS